MVREDIFGMLKTAAQRGKNPQQTAQSLVNSGYLKSEVDEAVNAFTMQGPGFQQPAPTIIQKPQPVQQPRPPAPVGQTKQIVSSYSYPSQPYMQPVIYPPQQYTQPSQFYQPQPIMPQFSQFPQIVSNYEQPKRPAIGKMITIIMIAMLAALIGVLVIVFLFKPELENFINNL